MWMFLAVLHVVPPCPPRSFLSRKWYGFGSLVLNVPPYSALFHHIVRRVLRRWGLTDSSQIATETR